MSAPRRADLVVTDVARLAQERDELAHLNDLLAARIAELEDTEREHDRELLRETYRRGYFAGRAAMRRRAPATTTPERHTRGALGEILR